MALTDNLKNRILRSLDQVQAKNEMVALLDQIDDLSPAANVPDVEPTEVDDIALSTSNTYTDAAVNTAVNAAVLQVNTAVGELADTQNAILAAMIAAGLMDAE